MLEDVEVDLGIDLLCPETELINRELKELIEKAIEDLPPGLFKSSRRTQYKSLEDFITFILKNPVTPEKKWFPDFRY